MSLATAPISDLPPRTWRRWWRELPGYWRIGAWAVLLVIGSNLAVALRIYIGLHEAGAIQVLRARGASIEYRWELEPDHQQWVIAGLLGKSPSNVTSIELPETTDADLQLIGSRFHNLTNLNLHQAEVSREGTRHLSNLSRLEEFNLAFADLDDDAFLALGPMPKLTQLSLPGTMISDASIPRLKSLPALKVVDLYYTDVTADAVREWQFDLEATQPNIVHDYEPHCVIGSIRWSDGRRSVRFRGAYALTIHAPWRNPAKSDAVVKGENLARNDLYWNPVQPFKFRDGDHRLTLKLNGYESEPVVISVLDDVPSATRVEFRMPVTKDEALRSVEK